VTVAAYYYPGFHQHPKFDERKKVGFTEWDLILNAKPRYPGHETTPPATLGSGAGIGSQGDGKEDRRGGGSWRRCVHLRLVLPRPGDLSLKARWITAFLNAKNNHRIKFCLMWANHDWYDIQGYNPGDGEPKLFFPGKVTPGHVGNHHRSRDRTLFPSGELLEDRRQALFLDL